MERRQVLWLTVLAIVIIVAGVVFWNSQREPEGPNLNRRLVEVDTAKVTGWRVTFPYDSNLNTAFVRSPAGWMVVLPTGQRAAADPGVIRRSLQHMSNLRPTGFSGSGQEAWQKFGVGDSGALLTIYEGGRTVGQLYLGDMFFMNNNQANHYVRLPGEDDVFSIDAYLDGSLRMRVEKSRKKELLACNAEALDSVKIQAQGKPSTTYHLEGGKWVSVNSSTAFPFQELCGAQAPAFVDCPKTEAEAEITFYIDGSTKVQWFLHRTPEVWVIESSWSYGNCSPAPENIVRLLQAYLS